MRLILTILFLISIAHAQVTGLTGTDPKVRKVTVITGADSLMGIEGGSNRSLSTIHKYAIFGDKTRGNVAIGVNSQLFGTATAEGNATIGIGTLQSNNNGQFNLALLYQALNQIEGNHNIGIGYRAGFGQTVGNRNTAIGTLQELMNSTADNQLAFLHAIFGKGVNEVNGLNISTGNIGIFDTICVRDFNVNGTVRFYNLGTASIDTSTFKPLAINSSGDILPFHYWPVGSGGGGGSGTVNSGTQYRLAYYATTGTAVSEAAAITSSRALVSDANGVPTHATTTTTQLNYLGSATGTTGTTSTNLVFSGAPTFTTRITTPIVDGTTTSGGELALNSTSHGTKGFTRIGNLFHFDEVNTRFGIGVSNPTASFQLQKAIANGWFIGSTYAQLLFGSNSSTDAAEFYKPASGAFAIEHNGKDIVLSIGNGSYSGVNGWVLKGATGRVGIGTNTPSAWWHLARAGTTTVPSMLLASSTLTSTPVAGAIGYNGHFAIDHANNVRTAIAGSLSTVFTSTGNVGTGEDNLHSYSVPAGTLSVDGDYLDFAFSYSVAANSTLKVYFGATQLFSFAALATDAVYRVTGQIVRTSATTQRATFVLNGGATVTTTGYQTPGETLSGAVTFRSTGEGVSNNDIVQTLSLIKFFPAN